jgi:PHD/YefM family antitoxin component YafN of YafNO toxin-antitoxin module
MQHATVTSREFVHNVSAAKRLAAAGPVFITDRGKPAFALLNMEDFRRMSNPKGQNIVDLLSMPEAADFEIAPVSIGAREVEL